MPYLEDLSPVAAMEFDSASAIVGGAVTGRHLLHIENYSHTKLLPVDECIYSQPFSIGGRTWRIVYCPAGVLITGLLGIAHNPNILIAVDLDDTIPESAYADTRFLLLDRAGKEMSAHTRTTGKHKYRFPGDAKGAFFKRESVEVPECLADDCFKVRVEITVFTGVRSENRGIMASAAPPSDLHRHLSDLLVSMDGADVTFQVAGETFRAHRCILAARSPVFKAELFGAMRGSNAVAEVCIRIHDMVPHAFSALLHFVYTDSLPPECTGHGEEEAVMAQHLLEAADRYDMPRLKVICEEKLCRCLDTRTAATTLVLADQHHCHSLKKACIEFLRCPQILKAVMATDGFELIRSYPNLLKEVISKVTAP